MITKLGNPWPKYEQLSLKTENEYKLEFDLLLSLTMAGLVIINVSIYHRGRVLRYSTGQQGHIASLNEDPQPLQHVTLHLPLVPAHLPG